MNFIIKFGADALLKSKSKTKIIVCIVCAFFFTIIMPAAIASAAVAAPFVAAAEQFDEFKDTANTFMETTGEKISNLFSGRGFTVIDEDKIKTQEDKVYAKLQSKYDDFSDHGVQLDLPLIAATIYYPMNFVYDEKTIENLNNMNGTTENQVSDETAESAAYDKLYDYYKKVRKDGGFIDKLANNSISETITIYDCEVKETTSGGETLTYYDRGAQIDTTGPQAFDGTFGDKETCDKDTDSITVYTYQNDPERYDAYLRDTHIDENTAYAPLFEGLEGEAKSNKLESVISEIHGLRSLYASIIGTDQMMAGSYSSVCTSGVIVVGGDYPGVYSLEDYIAGVVANENNYQDPNDPENIEAMKAQAIAARTYLLSHTNYCASPIENSQSAQTFNRNPSERAKRAAQETAGLILTYDGKIFSSEYDSFYCTEVTTCPAEGDCSCEYTMEPFPVKHTVSVPASFASSGAGGHGRGMSQIAARYLQTTGYDYKQILQYFYSPGVQITQTGGAENGADGIVTVENGTFIIPKDMNSGMPGSKGSGPNGFNIYFWQRLSSFFSAAKAAGYDIGYTDAWRAYDLQVSCYNDPDKISKDGDHLCATPGTSMHGWGIAADLNFYENKAAQDWAHTNAASFNLDFAVCADYFGGSCLEPWHIQPSEIVKR
jgi:CubicO group peptidase (beta-lactamase class C family)